MTPRPSKVSKDKYDLIVIFRLLDIALNTWTLKYVLFTACHKKRWHASKPLGGGGGVELEARKERFLTKCIRNWIGKGGSCSPILIVNFARIDFASDEYFIPFGSLGLPVVSIQLDLVEV